MKVNDYLNTLQITANQSQDPNTKVGAVIIGIDEKGKETIVSTGYNRMPLGKDDSFPWHSDAQVFKDTKYPYVVHAELDAIIGMNNFYGELEMLISIYPCRACARLIAHSGISKVYYKEFRENIITNEIFLRCNIEAIQIE